MTPPSCPAQMESIRTNRFTFNEDYISLLTPELELAHSPGIRATMQSQSSWRLPPRLEYLLSSSAGHQSSTGKEETITSVAIANMTSETHVHMNNHLSGSQHEQGTNHVAVKGIYYPGLIDLSLPKPLRLSMSSAQVDDGGEYFPNTPSLSLPSLSAQIDAASCQVSSSSSKAVCSLPMQVYSITTTRNSLGFANGEMLGLANPWPPTPSQNASTKNSLSKSSLGALELAQHTNAFGVQDVRSIQAAGSKDLKEKTANSHNNRAEIAQIDNELGGIGSTSRSPTDSQACDDRSLSHPSPASYTRYPHDDKYPACGPSVMSSVSEKELACLSDNIWSNTVAQRKSKCTYLPFKIQHELLGNIQTLIEETCFYFAQKWLPELLKRQGWSTPEQGELTSWWALLQDCHVPPQAIAFGDIKASVVFKNCRQIRNCAVHREPVSVPGIKSMIWDAINLTGGFKDVIREGKLRKFQDCLDRRDLDALQRIIDEPLANFKTFQDTQVPSSKGWQDGNITKQTQTAPYMEGTVSQNPQSAMNSKLLSPITSLKNNEVAARTAPHAVENGLSALQLDAPPNTPPIESDGQEMRDYVASNQIVLEKEQSVADIVNGNIIDLTQESDDEIVIDIEPDFYFSGRKQASQAWAAFNRAMEPKRRKNRERKKRLRKRRRERYFPKED